MAIAISTGATTNGVAEVFSQSQSGQETACSNIGAADKAAPIVSLAWTKNEDDSEDATERERASSP